MVIKVFPALLRRKGCLLITAGAILVPFTIFILIIGPDLRIEQNLSQKLAECQMRLQVLTLTILLRLLFRFAIINVSSYCLLVTVSRVDVSDETGRCLNIVTVFRPHRSK